ncbi:MAG TPA: permease, partial [Pseudomonadota bacterium]|nr:permease [Pseudomonadota bacterium]
PSAGVAWLGRGSALAQSVRGVLFGLPLPICSCGVLPVYRSLIVRGAPAAAALSFLVAAPELGVDAVLLSFPLLGLPLTVARIVCAFVVAVLAGSIVSRFLPAHSLPNAIAAESPATTPSFWQRARTAYQIGYVETVDHTAPWIVLGLAIAAALEPLLRIEWVTALPKGLDVPLLALLGLPMYVCASSATPLVAVLIHKGISPGAAVAFLLTGPATNATTYGVLAQLHGRRVAVLYGVVIAALTISLGFLINHILGNSTGYPFHVGHDHSGILYPACLLLLFLLFATSFLRQGPRGFIRQLSLDSSTGMSSHDGHSHHDHSHHDHSHAGHSHHDHSHHDHGSGHDHSDHAHSHSDHSHKHNHRHDH